VIKNKLMVVLAEKELTLTELSQLTGIRYATLWSFGKNKTQKADYEIMDRICTVLECTPGDLLHYIRDTKRKGETEESE